MSEREMAPRAEEEEPAAAANEKHEAEDAEEEKPEAEGEDAAGGCGGGDGEGGAGLGGHGEFLEGGAPFGELVGGGLALIAMAAELPGGADRIKDDVNVRLRQMAADRKQVHIARTCRHMQCCSNVCSQGSEGVLPTRV